jgi:hypothetical protein
VLVGTALRKALCVIPQHKAFGAPPPPGEPLEVKVKQSRYKGPHRVIRRSMGYKVYFAASTRIQRRWTTRVLLAVPHERS